MCDIYSGIKLVKGLKFINHAKSRAVILYIRAQKLFNFLRYKSRLSVRNRLLLLESMDIVILGSPAAREKLVKFQDLLRRRALGYVGM